MANCFNGCESLESLDLSTWEARLVTDVSNMFKDCISLKDLDMRNISLLNDLDSPALFTNVMNLEKLRLDNCNLNTTLYLIRHLYDDNNGSMYPCVIYINQATKEQVFDLNLPFVYMIV
jgi:surface protein